jgi:hypothetical protein
VPTPAPRPTESAAPPGTRPPQPLALRPCVRRHSHSVPHSGAALTHWPPLRDYRLSPRRRRSHRSGPPAPSWRRRSSQRAVMPMTWVGNSTQKIHFCVMYRPDEASGSAASLA